MRLTPPAPAYLCSLLAASVFSIGTVARADDGPQRLPARPVLNYDEAKVGAYVLPDPLQNADGTRVVTVAQWEQTRRPELLRLFAQLEYGVTPVGIPAGTHWKVTGTDAHALGGKAVRKEITIWFGTDEAAAQIHLLIYQPAVTDPHAPWPVFLGFNYNGNASITNDAAVALPTCWLRNSAPAQIVDHHATAGTRGASVKQWPVERLLAHGYAVATFCYCEICPDENALLDQGIGRLYRTTPGRDADTWGALGQWAWGLSRAMDYLVSDADFDAKRVAIVGHSRLGKAVLWAGAQDSRFALVISNESGCSGAKIGRRNFGQTPTDISISFPYWFCPAYAGFQHHDDQIPIDQNELLALIAPRGLYVAAAEGDRGSDSVGQFLGLKGAEPVYALYGRAPLPVATKPAVNTPVASDTLGFHERTGPHEITVYDWTQYIAFADRLYLR